MPGITPSQTIGPFFAILPPLGSAQLVPATDPAAIELHGHVFDGAGDRVTDALIEIWQANRFGRYHHPEDTQELPLEEGFSGFGRCATNAAGSFTFLTVKPGRVPYDDERMQAPHVTLTLFARGLLRHLVTRVYFEDEAEANHADPVLQSIGDPAVRVSLIAAKEGEARYQFDIHLQGERETAFFAI